MAADTTTTTREALQAALREAETGLQRAQNAAYYAHKHLLESRSPEAADG